MTLSTTSSATYCEPRQATPRDPDRPTDGAAAAVAARLLGRTMPPWARAAVDVLGELDDRGRYAYPIAVILVPRQSAKTTTAYDLAIGRGLVHRDYRAAYAAQTGHVTTERMGDLFTAIAQSQIHDRVKARLSQGTERVTIKSRSSYLKAFPPKDGALRSSALDLVILDEAQEHADEPLGRMLDHTIMPTFTTRPRRQFLILGTAPELPGTMLERYATLARAGAPGVALIDYGAREDEDPGDPDTWRRRHPGLAAGLTDEAYLRSQYELDPVGFAREHLNVWPERGAAGGKFPPGTWARSAVDLENIPPVVALAVDVEPDRDSTAIGAAHRLPDGRTLVQLLAVGPGTAWVRESLEALCGRVGRVPVAYDSKSQAAAVIEAWPPSRSLDLDPVDTTGYARACSGLYDALVTGTAVHLASPELDAAASGAVARPMLDLWAWSRTRSTAPASPLVACSLAWHTAHRPAPARPVVRSRHHRTTKTPPEVKTT